MFALPRFWFGGVDVHTHRGYSPGCSVRGCVSLGDMEDNEEMRILVKKGETLFRYGCRLCGQIELLSKDEDRTCLNCGASMLPVNEDGSFPESVKEKTPETDQKPKHKGGRPRKAQPGTCSACKNALRNDTGYTCELDWQCHAGTETCPNHKDGVPVD